MAALALLPGTLASRAAFAASDPQAIRCIEDFLTEYKKVSKYDTVLLKKEWDETGKPLHDEKIGLSFEKPNHVTFKYLNPGSTGIRNSGMTVKYTGGETVDVRLGKPNVLGFLVNGVGSLIANGSSSLYAPRVLDDEVFTLNRAGFDYMAFALSKHLETLKTAVKGGVTLEPGAKSPCTLHYLPHLEGDELVELEPKQSMLPIEEKFATLDYLIWRKNQDQFPDFADLFKRDKKTRIKVPRSFAEFTAELDPATRLPRRFALFYDGKKVADYAFEETRYVEP